MDKDIHARGVIFEDHNMHRIIISMAILCFALGLVERHAAASESAGEIPIDAKYACPMEAHPNETDPTMQGPYFSAQPGKCPRCGMELKPMDELSWARLLQAAKGADVAYTCPDHQHVFSKTSGECPRCGHRLMPFKVMYTCPDPNHAGVISPTAENCPRCGRGLAAYRGVWLDESMADLNLPPSPGLAEAALYRCPLHPLVHSDKPGTCTICARPLESVHAEAKAGVVTIPSSAKYACPMQECRQFSDQPGECSVCGMNLKPIDEVDWARELRDRTQGEDRPEYVCPMHPEQVRSGDPGTCPICGMQLVHAATFSWPSKAPEHVAAQVDYLAEHYLELQSLLASDRIAEVARQALALLAASEELARHLDDPGVHESRKLRTATERLRAAALKITGENMEQDRAAFVGLSAAMSTLIEVVRPSRDRWPKLYIYHCTMSKGDWIQSGPEKRNPYYGFKMLTCGELKDVK